MQCMSGGSAAACIYPPVGIVKVLLHEITLVPELKQTLYMHVGARPQQKIAD